MAWFDELCFPLSQAWYHQDALYQYEEGKLVEELWLGNILGKPWVHVDVTFTYTHLHYTFRAILAIQGGKKQEAFILQLMGFPKLSCKLS